MLSNAAAADTACSPHQAVTDNKLIRCCCQPTCTLSVLQIQTAANLPGQTHTLGQYTALGNSYRVTLTGYPAQSGDPGCTTSAYAGACYQYSSTDTMQTSTSGMYSSSNLDLCSGHSGSGVMTPDGNKYVTAIVTGEVDILRPSMQTLQPCITM